MTRRAMWSFGVVVTVLAFVLGFLRPWRQWAALDLDRLAAEANQQLPTRVDEATELTRIHHVAPHVLAYEYVVRDEAVANALRTTPIADTAKGIVHDTCGNPALRDRFLRRGVSLRHVFADARGVSVASVEVAPANCEAEP